MLAKAKEPNKLSEIWTITQEISGWVRQDLLGWLQNSSFWDPSPQGFETVGVEAAWGEHGTLHTAQLWTHSTYTWRGGGTFLVVQWLRIYLPMHGTWVQSLAGKLRSHMLQGNQTCTPQVEKPAHFNEDPAQPKKQTGGRGGSSAHSPAVGRKEPPLGKREWAEMSSGHLGGCKSLTKWGNQCKVLQHHITVQESLSLIKESPLLLGEVNGHVFKGHTALSWWWGQFIPWSASFLRTPSLFTIQPPPQLPNTGEISDPGSMPSMTAVSAHSNAHSR